MLTAETARSDVQPEGTAGHAPAVPAAGQNDIVVTDVHKAFGVTKALNGCSFSASRGEIHAIVGGNGCGKSTLAKVLSGVLPIDSGQVSILGHTPTAPREARLIGIATVFQEVLVADECTVLDNLFVGSDGLWTRSLSAREKYRATEATMKDLTGLDIDPDAMVGGLPLSLKQWITIGRALLYKPKVLILDESSAALDFDSTEKLFEKMRELRDNGTAVLIVTHRIAELIRISDRATVMRDGRDVGVLDKGDITEKNLLGLMTGKSATTTISTEAAVEVAHHDSVLQTRGLKVWPDGPAIDFDLHRGEIIGVAGLDGQGQNEFVRVLAGVQAAEEGVPSVRNEGEFEPLFDLISADRCKVTYVSGDRKREGIFPNLSIFENLLIPLYPKTMKTRVAAVIDWASLSSIFDAMSEKLSVKLGFKSDKITSLSGGNQQKVLIGRAFALRPNILILNDPARGIDVEAKRELYHHLRDFAAQGHSVVFMSSELEEFIGLCSRVLVFRHGGIFDEFVGEQIDPDRILEAMFGHTVRAPGAAAGAPDTPERGKARVAGAEGGPALRRPLPARPAVRREAGQLKIIDFDKERARARDALPENGPESGPESGPKQIKIVYFDD